MTTEQHIEELNVADHPAFRGHEQVLFCRDASAGYRGIIAIHNTALGPAVGGTRFWTYSSEAEALDDVLRLSHGMTYKSAMAGMPFGGGKSIIFKDGETNDRHALFRAHGRFVNQLNGRYIAAEDVGTTPSDMDVVHLETKHVAGLSGPDGDPSPWTALGVLRGMQAAALFRWGSEDLSGRTVALQGCGHVGYELAKELRRAGARLIVTDIDRGRAEQVGRELSAGVVDPESIYAVEADIFAPCALGGILNDETIPQLNVQIVAGAANNQLLADRHGVMVRARDILYVPDYVINPGGALSGGRSLLGWSKQHTLERVRGVYDTVLTVLQMAEADGLPTHAAADRIAEDRLRRAQGSETPSRNNGEASPPEP